MSKHAWIIGCGYVGSEAARQLLAAGWTVSGVSRSGTAPEGVDGIAADVLDLPQLPRADAVIYAVSPGGRSEKAYSNAYEVGPAAVLAQLCGTPFILVGSTGVYGTADGSWVDETVAPEPQSVSGCVLERAESAVLEAGGTVLRLGGIYGPGRTGGLTRALRGGDRYLNRIHRDDAAAAAIHLALQPETRRCGQVFLGVDSCPATADEVQAWLRDHLAPEALPAAPPATHAPRHGSHKRCRNAKLLATGFSFLYPSFRDGYVDLVSEWRRQFAGEQ
jgi:nucleoside-diphosphate-sugar epimerase